jgi:hypothetical protein
MGDDDKIARGGQEKDAGEGRELSASRWLKN